MPEARASIASWLIRHWLCQLQETFPVILQRRECLRHSHKFQFHFLLLWLIHIPMLFPWAILIPRHFYSYSHTLADRRPEFGRHMVSAERELMGLWQSPSGVHGPPGQGPEGISFPETECFLHLHNLRSWPICPAKESVCPVDYPNWICQCSNTAQLEIQIQMIY